MFDFRWIVVVAVSERWKSNEKVQWCGQPVEAIRSGPRERWRLGQSQNNVQMMRQWHRAQRWMCQRESHWSIHCRAIRTCQSTRWTVTAARNKATSLVMRSTSNPHRIRQVLSPVAHCRETNVSILLKDRIIFAYFLFSGMLRILFFGDETKSISLTKKCWIWVVSVERKKCIHRRNRFESHEHVAETCFF